MYDENIANNKNNNNNGKKMGTLNSKETRLD